MSLTGTRIFLVASPAFFLGMVAGGAVMYQRSSLLATSEDRVLSFKSRAATCSGLPETAISVTRVASIVRAIRPAGVGGKGFVEQGNYLRADLNQRNKPVITLQGTLGKDTAENTWKEAEGQTPCQGTWSSAVVKASGG